MFKVMNIIMVSIWTCPWFIEQRFCNWDLVAYTTNIRFEMLTKMVVEKYVFVLKINLKLLYTPFGFGFWIDLYFWFI